MPGFGSGKFGQGGFGEWDWATIGFVERIPEIYKIQDEELGDGKLTALAETIAVSLNNQRHRIRDYDELRDPLLCQTERTFSQSVTIIGVEDLGDGTSRAFLSEGPNGDAFDGIRIGQTLEDGLGNRFPILKINSSWTPAEVSDPPIDPATGLESGKFVQVSNIALGARETLPFISGAQFQDENPASTDNGLAPPPYTFTVSHVPLSTNVVTVTWTEVSDPAVQKTGIFLGDGQITGDFGISSSIDFTTGAIVVYPKTGGIVSADSFRVTYSQGPEIQSEDIPQSSFIPDTVYDDGIQFPPYTFVVSRFPVLAGQLTVRWTELAVPKAGAFDASGVPSGSLGALSEVDFLTGQVTMYTASAAKADANSIRVTYVPSDCGVKSQHVLAFLGRDYGVSIDRHDPDVSQRAYVFDAWQLWDLKGTYDGYCYFGAIANFFVNAQALYRIDPLLRGVFITPALGDNGAALPPYVFFLAHPLAALSTVILWWTESAVAKSGTITETSAGVFSVTGNVGVGSLFDSDNAVVTLINAGGAAVDDDSIRVSYGAYVNENPEPRSRFLRDLSYELPADSRKIYTTVDPKRALIDDCGADQIPLDVFTFDPEIFPDLSPGYPTLSQTVTATSVSSVRSEGLNTRYRIEAATVSPEEGLELTDGIFIDLNGREYQVQNFSKVSSLQYEFEVLGYVAPVTGLGSIEWKAPTYGLYAHGLTDFYTQYVGYSGQRYRVKLVDYDVLGTNIPVIGNVGDWAFIDADGNVYWIDAVVGTGTYTSAGPVPPAGSYPYIEIEFVSQTAMPSLGSFGYVFYASQVQTTCDFCRASLLRVGITPEPDISDEELSEDALGRLINRLAQMIPAHVRIVSFVYDPGVVVVSLGASASVDEIIESSPDEEVFATAIYDEAEFGPGPEDDELITDVDAIDPGAFLLPPGGDNGTNLPPYLFFLDNAITNATVVTVSWTEASVAKTGTIAYAGAYILAPDVDISGPSFWTVGGDVDTGSRFYVANGAVELVNVGGAAIDDDSIRVSYDSYVDENPENKGGYLNVALATAVSVTNPYVFEESVDVRHPLLEGGWTATGLWHVGTTRTRGEIFDAGAGHTKKYYSGSARFIYGKEDLASPYGFTRLDTTPWAHSGVLTTPMIEGISGGATAVGFSFNFYITADFAVANYLPEIRIRKADTTILKTYAKADFDLHSTSTLAIDGKTHHLGGCPTGDWCTFSDDVVASVAGQGDFYIEFEYATGPFPPASLLSSYEGWYLDDIRVKVT